MWEQYVIETPRGAFEVFVKGSGTPLCITHNYSSFNTSGDYFANTFIENHRVFLVNLRECGNSPKVQHSYQLGLLETVFDLEAIREGLGFEKWAYAGHSTGGILGIIYGIYFSESLNFEIIVGAAARDYMTFSKNCIYNNEHPHFEKMQNLFKSLKNENLSVDVRNELKIERTKLSLYSPNKYEDYFSLNIAKDMSANRLNFFDREIQLFDVTRKLKFISAPTLIICGKYDVQCPVEYSIEMNELISTSKLVIMDESNHYPFLEEKERFLKEYRTFLDEITV
ncbi:alpha/beta fold hydrolase [Kurthia sp. Dielmo]|uniref:alpha/beta fold hydrolase n=1 Tax=Kurthia sp. Dielmo TaxID=1033738 RepID=UPI00111E6984|nr:alpha/beta hydrolase [Kurthia sp. Dielmo]